MSSSACNVFRGHHSQSLHSGPSYLESKLAGRSGWKPMDSAPWPSMTIVEHGRRARVACIHRHQLLYDDPISIKSCVADRSSSSNTVFFIYSFAKISLHSPRCCLTLTLLLGSTVKRDSALGDTLNKYRLADEWIPNVHTLRTEWRFVFAVLQSISEFPLCKVQTMPLYCTWFLSV